MARVQPARQIARYDLSVVPPFNESNEREIEPMIESSSSPPTPKSTKFPWLNLFWIGLAVLISICLVITVIVPIVVSTSQTTNATSTTGTTICPTTSITTTVTSSPLPAQCSNYTINTDETRRFSYTATSTCDYEAFDIIPTWVRFQDPAGTLLATCPTAPNGCGTQFPGWYTGLYPSTAGDRSYGEVCYISDTDLCFDTSGVIITNCNGFFVFYLRDPPICDMRYCTI